MPCLKVSFESEAPIYHGIFMRKVSCKKNRPFALGPQTWNGMLERTTRLKVKGCTSAELERAEHYIKACRLPRHRICQGTDLRQPKAVTISVASYCLVHHAACRYVFPFMLILFLKLSAGDSLTF